MLLGDEMLLAVPEAIMLMGSRTEDLRTSGVWYEGSGMTQGGTKGGTRVSEDHLVLNTDARQITR